MNEDIITVLNKLCRRKVTAAKAVSLLYRLSITENGFQEEAKTSIRNKFFTHLSNNALNFDKRIEVLEGLKNEYGITESLIHIYGSMLKTDRFYGSISTASDEDNSQDFDIQDSKEIGEYYEYALKGICEAIEKDEFNFLKLIEEKLNERLSEQYRYGNSVLILEIIEQLAIKKGKLPIKLRSNIDALILSTPKLSEEDIENLNVFLEKFKVQSIEEELSTIVIEAPYLSERNGEGGYNDISKKRAQDLAKKYIEKKIDWETFLPSLLINEQRQTFHFAEKIGQIDYPHEVLLEKALDFLKTIDEKNHNILFINGLVLGVGKNEFTRKAIEQSLNNKNTIGLGIHLTKFIKPILQDNLREIKPFLIQNPDYLRLLEYIDLLHLKNEELVEITSWLKTINYSFSLEVIYNVLRKDLDRWKELENHIGQLLFKTGILRYSSFINSTIHIEELIKLWINSKPEQNKIEFILNEIIECYQDFHFHNDTLLNSLIYFLLENYWENSWAYLGDYIVEYKKIPSKLSYVLNTFNFNNTKLLTWVKEKPGTRAEVAMGFMNIFKKTDDITDKLEFSPSVLVLIDQYGNNKKMLYRLDNSLTSYRIHSISAEKLYLKRKELVQTLRDHPLEEVRAFSSRMSTEFDFLIEQEKNFEANYNNGY